MQPSDQPQPPNPPHVDNDPSAHRVGPTADTSMTDQTCAQDQAVGMIPGITSLVVYNQKAHDPRPVPAIVVALNADGTVELVAFAAGGTQNFKNVVCGTKPGQWMWPDGTTNWPPAPVPVKAATPVPAAQ